MIERCSGGAMRCLDDAWYRLYALFSLHLSTKELVHKRRRLVSQS